jgi:hypothetical protein
MQQRLEHIYSRRSHWPHRRPEAPGPNLDRLSELLSSGARSPAYARSNPARGFVRRLVLRIIKPFTAYQRMVDDEALQILRRLSSDITKTRDTLSQERVREAQRNAAQLAELRRQSARIDEMGGELNSELTNPELSRIHKSVSDAAAANGGTEKTPEISHRND